MLVSLQGVPGLGEREIRGFIAATKWQDWSYTFVALSVAEEWDKYESALRRILDHVDFEDREQPAQYVPDPWEPDDSLAEANEMEASFPQTHDLHRPGDRDYLRFEATRGHIYTVETFKLGEDIDTQIYLYDAEGQLLAHNDDGRGLEELWASRLLWTAQRTDTLYVMIQDVGGNAAGPGSTYDIRLWEEAHFVEDEYEPDDSPDKATRLETESHQVHNLHLAGDHDWVRIEVRPRTRYTVETFGLGPDVDTALYLYDEDGNELASDDNGRGDEEKGASRLTWTAHGDSVLYIMVQDLGDHGAGPGTEYRVRLLPSTL